MIAARLAHANYLVLRGREKAVAKKTSCPISRAEFKAHAKKMSITIGGKSYDASPREFSTGSLGWNVNDKLTIEIDGKDVTVQIGMNLTVVGSKELPQEGGSAGAASSTDVA
jgi:hypothetical protein